MNMTGDPNQPSSTNFFGANYNTFANPVDWPKIPNQPVVTNNLMNNTPQFPTTTNFGTAFPQPTQSGSFFTLQPIVPNPVESANFSPPTTPLTNYCFGGGDSKPQAVPVQFPFPVPSTSTAGGEFGNKPLHIPFRCKRKTDSPP